MVAAPLLAPAVAHANHNDDDERYCREYTKSVRIGGALRSAYGTACMQPDGSWEMVSLGGHNDLYDDLARNANGGNGRLVRVEHRAPDYWYPGYYERPFYRQVYRQPANVFSFYWGDNDRNDRRDWRRHDRRDDRHDDRGRHNGHRKHGRGNGHDHDH